MIRKFSSDSNDNTLFVTARCNNNCIMCCQPPLNVDDTEELYARNIAMLDCAPKNIKVVGISGGEPSLLGARLIDLIRHIRLRMPDTDIHMLSNGRLFSDMDYARRVADASEGRLTVGIPLHSDYYRDHDMMAGAQGAFNEAIAGICNLAVAGAAIELRVVIQRINYMRLQSMAEFINKNLPFVAWTAFIGLEHTGKAIANDARIWIEPVEYAEQLKDGVLTLAQCGHDVAIYNIPLCLLHQSVHRYACRSISDWKNRYLPVCDSCRVKNVCCGLFTTSRRVFDGITPLN